MNVQAILLGLEAGPSELSLHIPLLYQLASNASRPLELGVCQGNSTVAFMCACSLTGRRLCSVDLVDYEESVRERLRSLELKDSLWVFVQGNDVAPETVEQVRQVSKTFDFIFVDTSHVREHTIEELAVYYPLLEKGGAMAFHDTHTELYAGGVYEPLLEFMAGHPECRIIHDEPGAYGLTAVQKAT